MAAFGARHNLEILPPDPEPVCPACHRRLPPLDPYPPEPAPDDMMGTGLPGGIDSDIDTPL
jgi:hypothetical protein